MEAEGEKDVAGRHVQAAPAVARGRAVRGQVYAARGHGCGPRVVYGVRHVVPPQPVLEGVGEWPEEARVAGGGGRGGACRPRAVVGVAVPPVRTVGEALCSRADPVVWVAG